MSEITTIQVGKKTRDRLKDFRLKDETQDDALNRALDIAEKRILEATARNEDP